MGRHSGPPIRSTGAGMIETKRKGFLLYTQIPVADTVSTSDLSRGSLACFPRFGAGGRGGSLTFKSQLKAAAVLTLHMCYLTLNT